MQVVLESDLLADREPLLIGRREFAAQAFRTEIAVGTTTDAFGYKDPDLGSGVERKTLFEPSNQVHYELELSPFRSSCRNAASGIGRAQK